MTETTTSKVEKWAYPLKVGTAEATDPQQFYKALAKAKDGYYPLGANGLWHGGVHFDEDSGLVEDLTEVRCIADGEVVAYRIDEKYPTSDFGSTHSVYSTGFVLVKHRLELPAPPAPVAGSAPGAASAAGPSLTFFSLYMHLLDWEGYKLNPTLARPGFWGKGLYQVKANLQTQSLGLRVRSGNSSQTPILAVIPRGTTVFTKPAAATQQWLEVVSVTPEFPGLAPNTGWVFKGQMKHLGGESYFVGEEAKDAPPDQKRGANVRGATSNGLPIAFLPTGTQIRISDEQAARQYRKLVEIVSGQPSPALMVGSDGKLPGFVWLDDLEAKNEPHTPIGQVVPLTQTFKIKAGEVLGHVGKYQSHSDAAPKNLLHLEVFSCENVKTFTDQSRDKAISLPATEKTLVKIPAGTWLVIHTQGMSATNPPKAADPGNKVGYDFYIPVGLLESLPAEKKIKESVVMGGATTITYWWRLDGLLGDKDGNGIDGWFAEPDIVISRHSPFEWNGFTFIDETTSNVDHLAAFLHAQENLDEQERETYLPNVEAAAAGSVNETLYKILDRNGDKKLASSEIAEALGKPWFSQPISQMVTRYENEWDYKKETWDALDEIMGHSDSDPHKAWIEEKSRIERLSWWVKLLGQHGITADINVQHIHPVGLVSNFLTIASPSTCKKCGKNIALTPQFMRKVVAPSVSDGFINSFVEAANAQFAKYEVTTCSQVALILGQGKVETGRFTKFRESLNYSRATFTAASLFALAPTAINNGFVRKGLSLTNQQKLQYIDDHLLGNDPAYGKHSFGSSDYPDNDYRGRGLLHLTHYETYKRCANAIGVRIDATPLLAETDVYAIVASGSWFWKQNNIGVIADNTSLDIDLKIKKVTKVINTGLDQLALRNTYSKEIMALINSDFGGCAG
jgi:predicted chitinase